MVFESLTAGGRLERQIDQFRVREGQLLLARRVGQMLEEGGVLVAEAATGVGKTFAYLVPVLLSGERVLLSTATKALQDQLFGRDLPRLMQALGLPLRTALLKGRSSYLCLRRLELARQDPRAQSRAVQADLARVERWARTTRSGDLAEMDDLDERSPAIPLVTSTRENCLGSDCPMFQSCHVNRARREAMAADVVVVNHHLFFADLVLRQGGMAELLPSVRAVVFDEAHKLNEIGIQFLGDHLGSGQLLDLARDLLAVGLQQGRGLADWNMLAGRLEAATRQWRLAAGRPHQRQTSRLRWAGSAPEGADAGHWAVAMAQIDATLNTLAATLEPMEETSPDFVRLRERAVEFSALVGRFGIECRPGRVRWADLGRGMRLVESPLDIADAMRSRILGGAGQGEPGPGADGRAWVFVSATLGEDEALSWFTHSAGLEQASTLRIPSPFDYARQAALYVPTDFPAPGQAGHSERVAELVAQAASVIGGRTLVLTTTLRALRHIGQHLEEHFQGDDSMEVLVQGQRSKRVLMDGLRASADERQPARILVGSASFWEGVDVPGDALQLVVIDKLPFPPPGDPLVEARCRRIEAEGGSAFADYSLPAAAVALKQGVGRLIRNECDRGVVVICDARLTTRGYGKRLLAALPPLRRLQGEQEFMGALRALVTEPSTEV